MEFYIKVKKTYWKEMRFKREIADQIKTLLEADDVHFMTESETRRTMIETSEIPTMEIKCYTCKSFVSNPYPMKHTCRRDGHFVDGCEHCMEWRSSKLSAQKRICDFAQEKIRRKQEQNDQNCADE